MSARLARLVAVAGCTACAATQTNLQPVAPTLLLSATRVIPADSGAHTESVALDRIAKRQPLLDGTTRLPGTGRGVTVYVFDGGISSEHPELAGRVRRGFDAFPDGPRVCNSHGTAVAGAIAGKTLGVVPAAEVVDVKMIECRRQRGTLSAILAGTAWAIRDHARHRGEPALVNWSFTVDTASAIPEIDSAVSMLRAAGMLVVVAAGNFDVNACVASPANAPGAFVVGASSLVRDSASAAWRDVRTPRTAWGPCVDLYAPGDSVLLPAVDWSGEPIAMLWAGTSMSAGYVSGAAALLLERQPTASPDRIIDLLKRTSTVNAVRDDRDVSGVRPTRLLYVASRPR